MTVMNVFTRLIPGKESEDTIITRFKTRSKDILKWATMMKSMQMMERVCQGSEVNAGARI